MMNHTSSTIPAYRLLAVDVDGTLVNSRDELSPATREALLRAANAGIQVVLATGRRYRRTLHLVEPLGIDVPLVTGSGALVKDPRDHRTLYAARFDPEVLRLTLEIIHQQGYQPLVCADTFADGYDFYFTGAAGANPQLAEYLLKNSVDGRIRADLVSDPPPGVFSGFTMGTECQMLELAGELEKGLPGELYIHVLRSPKYEGFMCEFSPMGSTKWSAVHLLAAGWGIADTAICAVGDDVNDIPMIRAAGLGVAMGNARPEVKAAADRIAPTHDNDGLVEVVNWLLGPSR